jgi:hypothetical protein
MRYNLESEIKRLLNDNEEILFCEQPRQGLIFHDSSIFLMPIIFILVLCSGMFIYLGIVMSNLSMIIITCIISFIFLIPTAGRFYFDLQKRASIIFCITDKRIIFLRHNSFIKFIKVFDINKLENLDFEVTLKDGTGNLKLGKHVPLIPKNPFFPWGTGTVSWSGKINTGFEIESINNVKEIFEKIEELRFK